MSRTNDEVHALVPSVPEPPTSLSQLATIDGLAGAAAFCGELGQPVTESRVRRAVNAGELPSFMVCAKLRFSEHDLFVWLMSMRRTSTGRPRGRAVSA